MVLFLHNRYRTTGGEERTVKDLLWLVREYLSEPAELLERDSASLGRTRAAVGLLRGGLEPGDVARAVRLGGARVVHAHNLHPAFGWRALAAARAAGARVVLHLHQYRLVCAIGVCFTRGAECTRCHGRNALPGIRLNCRGAPPEAAAYGAALSLWQHRLIEQADALIVPSAFARERLRMLGAPLPWDRVHVLPPPLRALAAQPARQTDEADPLSTGEVDLSLSGEADPSLSGEAGPSLSGEAGPSLSGEADLSLSGEADPSLSGEAGPSLSGEAGPSLSGEADPSLSTEADPSSSGYALVVSRLAPEKGVDVAIEACRLAGLPLVVAGDGPELGALRELAGDANVRFAGGVNDTELISLRAGASVALVPSRSAETFGMAAAEAMAWGLPVAASRIGALPELLDASSLAPPGDAPALAEAIARVLADTAAGPRGLDRVRTVCAPGTVARGLASVYDGD